MEKHGQHTYFLHFYDKKHAEGAYEILKTGTHSFKNFDFLLYDQVEAALKKDEEGGEEEAQEVELDKEGFEYVS